MVGRRVRAEDVAEKAGVSRSTVSRVFTPGRKVHHATRLRILKAAKELDYQPNALAQALISKRSQIVGVLMGELTNPIHAALHQTLGRSLQERGLIPISAHLVPGEGPEDFISMFRQYQVGTVVLTSLDVNPDLMQALRDEGLDVVLLNRIDDEGSMSAICADMMQGGRLAARHLIERGCKRIGICEGAKGSWTSRARLEGHVFGLNSAGLTPVFASYGGYTYEAGSEIADRIGNKDLPMPDGLLCPNDLFAIGLMDRLRLDFGILIPDDIAVVGFDDIPMAEWESNALTTVRLPIRRMAERAADTIARHFDGHDAMDETLWIPCRLVARSSA